MAENNIAPELNLEQILATLASLPQTTTPPVPPQQQFQGLTQPPAQTKSLSASYHPAQTGTSYGHGQFLDPRLSSRPAPPSRQLVPPPKGRTTTPIIDPATVTEWKHGLRCVAKISQNPNFEPAIQKLIHDQERNVKDWEAGRQRLIEEQEAKRENEKAHLAVLSLPGVGANIAPLRTPETEKAELDEYDQKVYRACQRMVESQSNQLKSLGVPFFGLRPDLMLPEGGDATGNFESEDGKKRVTKKELLELQRKMLNHLMEMYGD